MLNEDIEFIELPLLLKETLDIERICCIYRRENEPSPPKATAEITKFKNEQLKQFIKDLNEIPLNNICSVCNFINTRYCHMIDITIMKSGEYTSANDSNVNDYDLFWGNNALLLIATKSFARLDHNYFILSVFKKLDRKDYSNTKRWEELGMTQIQIEGIQSVMINDTDEIFYIEYIEGFIKKHHMKTLENSSMKRFADKILSLNVDVNAQHLLTGWTPLHICCIKNEPCEYVKLLIEKGADINAVDFYGKQPLDYIVNYSLDRAKELINYILLRFKVSCYYISYYEELAKYCYTGIDINENRKKIIDMVTSL